MGWLASRDQYRCLGEPSPPPPETSHDRCRDALRPNSPSYPRWHASARLVRRCPSGGSEARDPPYVAMRDLATSSRVALRGPLSAGSPSSQPRCFRKPCVDRTHDAFPDYPIGCIPVLVSGRAGVLSGEPIPCPGPGRRGSFSIGRGGGSRDAHGYESNRSSHAEHEPYCVCLHALPLAQHGPNRIIPRRGPGGDRGLHSRPGGKCPGARLPVESCLFPLQTQIVHASC